MADSTKSEGENAGEQANPAASTVAQETSPSPSERDDSPENQGSESRCENDDEDYVVEEDDDDDDDDADKKDAATDATADSAALEETNKTRTATSGPVAVVSTSKKTRPSYKFDPDKITLRFLFANRDGLTVTIECQPSDTVGEVKGALMSVWPSDLPDCSGGDRLRLVCMGKGYLMPDTRTLEDCQIPVFKTHPTPINVSVKPEDETKDEGVNKRGGTEKSHAGGGSGSALATENSIQTGQGCGCVIL